MFDVGFSELILLFVIGLLVLGPEKLPQVANKLGSWVGQARRMTRMLKRQVEEELEFSKVRESVNQPLSSLMDKPVAKPKPKPKPTDLDYEDGEDDESGFGETGHADAEQQGDDRPVPDPAAPPRPDAGETKAGAPAAAGEQGDEPPQQSADQSRNPSVEEPAGEPGDHSPEDGAGSHKTTASS
ncbi:Sec-independent protein translocase protein TatB [Lentisalinibacter sediminis]|uniref:Sec-independent protein translocase protein TatB n=1 Tax=Lentisalinibacter sediminis TaxID=2992237 RepID=UPI00386F1EF1